MLIFLGEKDVNLLMKVDYDVCLTQSLPLSQYKREVEAIGMQSRFLRKKE